MKTIEDLEKDTVAKVEGGVFTFLGIPERFSWKTGKMPTLCKRRVTTGANRTDQKTRKRISRPGRKERTQERTQFEQPTNVEPEK